jgi:hypothetical protein
VAKLDAAPHDDEELSEEELDSLREGRREPAVPWSKAEAELDSADAGGWRIEIRPVALKSLRRCSRPDRERIRSAIGALPERDVMRLRGPERLLLRARSA